jgi:hypothetical protein
VVIQYRNRGLPWPLVLLLLVMIPIVSIAVYHRIITRRALFARPALLASRPTAADAATASAHSPRADATPTQAETKAEGEAVGEPKTIVAMNPASPDPSSVRSTWPAIGPLAENSQPVAGRIPTIADAPAPPVPPQGPAPSAAAEETSSSQSEADAPLPEAADLNTPVSVDAEVAQATKPTTDALTESGSGNEPGQESRDADSSTGPIAARNAIPAESAEVATDPGPIAEPGENAAPKPAAGSEDSFQPVAEVEPPFEGGQDADGLPDAQALPTREEVLAQIREEAAQKAADRRDALNMKGQAEGVIQEEQRVKARDRSIQFHHELRDLLVKFGDDSSDAIDELCDRFGRDINPDLYEEATNRLQRLPGRTTRQAKVRLLRSFGISEPVVLDFLANELHSLAHSRRCGCLSPQFRVLAARELTGVRGSSGTSSGTGRAAASPTSAGEARGWTTARGIARPHTAAGNRGRTRAQ